MGRTTNWLVAASWFSLSSNPRSSSRPMPLYPAKPLIRVINATSAHHNAPKTRPDADECFVSIKRARGQFSANVPRTYLILDELERVGALCNRNAGSLVCAGQWNRGRRTRQCKRSRDGNDGLDYDGCTSSMYQVSDCKTFSSTYLFTKKPTRAEPTV
jgi:hypothetical protein